MLKDLQTPRIDAFLLHGSPWNEGLGYKILGTLAIL